MEVVFKLRTPHLAPHAMQVRAFQMLSTFLTKKITLHKIISIPVTHAQITYYHYKILQNLMMQLLPHRKDLRIAVLVLMHCMTK